MSGHTVQYENEEKKIISEMFQHIYNTLQKEKKIKKSINLIFCLKTTTRNLKKKVMRNVRGPRKKWQLFQKCFNAYKIFFKHKKYFFYKFEQNFD